MAYALVGCGAGSMSSNTQSGGNQAAVFVTGEDAPVSSVVAFNITIDKITLNNSSTTVTALSTPVAVDFGRLVGLRSLLGFNTIPAGTYTSATVTFEASNPGAHGQLRRSHNHAALHRHGDWSAEHFHGHSFLSQRKAAGGGEQRPGRFAHGFQSAHIAGRLTAAAI